MSKLLIVPMIAIALVAMSWSGAYAGDDHFEVGFETEMGAIAARATVGLGMGLVRVVIQGDDHYGHHHGERHYRKPHYTKTVVYQPYPAPVRRVEHRVVYYRPAPPVYRPCR